VASWNLQERDLKLGLKGYSCQGQPLVFFHFSQFKPEKPRSIKNHQEGLSFEDLGEAGRIYLDYAQALLQHRFADCGAWPYAFEHFKDGSKISDALRLRYRETPPLQDWAGENPFENPQVFVVPSRFQAFLLKLAYLSPKSLRFG